MPRVSELSEVSEAVPQVSLDALRSLISDEMKFCLQHIEASLSRQERSLSQMAASMASQGHSCAGRSPSPQTGNSKTAKALPRTPRSAPWLPLHASSPICALGQRMPTTPRLRTSCQQLQPHDSPDVGDDEMEKAASQIADPKHCQTSNEAGRQSQTGGQTQSMQLLFAGLSAAGESTDLAGVSSSSMLATRLLSLRQDRDWQHLAAALIVQRWWRRVLYGVSAQLQLRLVWDQPDAELEEALKRYAKDMALLHSKSQAPGGRRRHSDSLSHSWGASDSKQRFAWLFSNFILRPESNIRIAWNLLSMIIIAFDLITVPMGTVDLIESRALYAPRFAIAMFWSVDVCMTLMTGIYKRNKFIINLLSILRYHARRTLIVDLSLVAIDWIAILLAYSEARALAALRIVKWLRFSRLLRVAMLPGVWDALESTTISTEVIAFLRLWKYSCSILLLNHMIACAWCGVGRSSSESWISALPDDHADSNSALYFTALHWSVTQFIGSMEVFPSNLGERVFAVMMLFQSLIIFSVFVGAMTNLALEFQKANEQARVQRIKLDRFLLEHGTPGELIQRITSYTQDARSRVKWVEEHDVASLRTLPDFLLMDLHTEFREPIIGPRHKLFKDLREYNPRTVPALCHNAMQEHVIGMGQRLFSMGDACESAYVVARGVLEYSCPKLATFRSGSSLSGQTPVSLRVERGSLLRMVGNQESELLGEEFGIRQFLARRRAWLADRALWAKWEHVGDCDAPDLALLIKIDAESFASTLQRFEAAFALAALYAKRVVGKHKKREIHDLSPPLIETEYRASESHTLALAIHNLAGRRSKSTVGSDFPAARPSYRNLVK